MTIQQKIKEFESTLKQKYNENEWNRNIQGTVCSLLKIYRCHFKEELENNSFTNDEEIHKMD